MRLHTLAALAGILTLLLSTYSSRSQMMHRREVCRQYFNIRFVNTRTGGFLDLTAGHYVIGRQRKKCDISLDDLDDPTISRVHAVLFWDGNSYCIAPVHPNSPFAHPSYPNVYIHRCGCPLQEAAVPMEGVKLRHGDVLRLGESEFTLKEVPHE